MRQYRVELKNGRIVAVDVEREKHAAAANWLLFAGAVSVSFLFIIEHITF